MGSTPTYGTILMEQDKEYCENCGDLLVQDPEHYCIHGNCAWACEEDHYEDDDE